MRLSHFRKKKGLTQSQLAKEVGVCRSVIALLESGHRKSWPKLRRKISDALDVDEKKIFKRD